MVMVSCTLPAAASLRSLDLHANGLDSGACAALAPVVAAQRRAMRKSLGHLLNRELSRGWRCWQTMIEERAAAMASYARTGAARRTSTRPPYS